MADFLQKMSKKKKTRQTPKSLLRLEILLCGR